MRAFDEILVVGLGCKQKGRRFSTDVAYSNNVSACSLIDLMQNIDIPPSGSRGLMLGEILGRNAGLTWTELLFVLFLPPRPLARASPRLLCSDPFGEPMGFKLGLVKEEPVAVTGALVGPILGVFRADIVGVVSSSCASEVRNGVKAGRFEDVLDVSGEVMVSIVCSSCASSIDVCSFSVEPVDLLAALRILINDDGVAGLSSVAGNGAECGPDEAAAIWGDLLAEADFGVAGGGIKTSDRGSGDMDSASELS